MLQLKLVMGRTGHVRTKKRNTEYMHRGSSRQQIKLYKKHRVDNINIIINIIDGELFGIGLERDSDELDLLPHSIAGADGEWRAGSVARVGDNYCYR